MAFMDARNHTTILSVVFISCVQRSPFFRNNKFRAIKSPIGLEKSQWSFSCCLLYVRFAAICFGGELTCIHHVIFG